MFILHTWPICNSIFFFVENVKLYKFRLLLDKVLKTFVVEIEDRVFSNESDAKKCSGS